MVLCCECGIEITPNTKNMCSRCLNNTLDVTARIITAMHIETCRGCARYHVPPKSWRTLAWASKDLLLHLLGRNKSIKKLNIIDSSFVYTEEHSKKIKVEIVILEEGIEQTCILEYSIRNRQCSDCMRAEAKQYWRAVVQLRQRPHHRRTFHYLEQLVLNHRAHLGTSNIKDRKDGIDFFFLDRGAALRLVEFLRGFYGIRTIVSEQLISEDEKNNTANKKFTFSVEILPFCRDDLIYLADAGLGIGHFALVTRVGNTVELLDPLTARTAKITCRHYFGNEGQYRILVRSDRFREYRVVYARPARDGWTEATVTEDGNVLYEVTTALRVKDDDVVLGYNLVNANLSMDIEMGIEVLLVRVFNDAKKEWHLKSDRLLDAEFRYFLDDISTDKMMLASVCTDEVKNRLADDVANVHL